MSWTRGAAVGGRREEREPHGQRVGGWRMLVAVGWKAAYGCFGVELVELDGLNSERTDSLS